MRKVLSQMKPYLRSVPGNVAESTLGAALILIVFILGLALLALLFVYGYTKTSVREAADQGARVAAYTTDQTQVESAISTVLSAQNLPSSWNGGSTYDASTTQITTSAGVPMTTLTMHYNAPNLFPNLPAAFGLGTGVNVPFTVTVASVDSEYFSEGGSSP